MHVMIAPIEEPAILVRRLASDLLILREGLVIDEEALEVIRKELKPV